MGMTNRGRWIGFGAAAVVVLAGAGIWGATAFAGHSDATTLAARQSSLASEPSPSASEQAPPTTTATSTTTTRPSATTPTTSATRPTSRVTTSSPGAVSQHTTCAGCKTVFSVDLSHGYHLDGIVQQTDAGANGWLDYRSGSRLVARSGLSQAKPLSDEAPTSGACQTTGGVQRCAVAFDTGAHSARVALVRINPGTGLVITDQAAGDSPTAQVRDLDGDGRSDALVVGSTYEPDYASGPRFWHTFVQRGDKFVSTGCGKPSTASLPVPTAPLTGTCPD
jgi:hypothetical protein